MSNEIYGFSGISSQFPHPPPEDDKHNPQLFDFFVTDWSTDVKKKIKQNIGQTSVEMLPHIEKNVTVVKQAYEKIKSGLSINELHEEAKKAIEKLGLLKDITPLEFEKEAAQINALLENRIMFEVGSKTVDLLFQWNLPLNDIVQKFYRDESHPMDLQRYFRDPERCIQVGQILNNLIKMNVSKEIELIISINETGVFNNFLIDYIEANFRRNVTADKPSNLIEVPTIPLLLDAIREAHDEYYSNLGIFSEAVSSNLTFSLPETQKGIVLFDSGHYVPEMGGKKFFQDVDFTYLRIPGADGRIVRISNEGYAALDKLHVQYSQDLIDIVDHLEEDVEIVNLFLKIRKFHYS